MRFSTGVIPDSSSHPANSPGGRICLVWVFMALLPASAARAEHFDIKLVAAGPNGTTQQAFADQTPPVGGLNPRPVLRVRAGDTIAIQFVMTDVYAHGDAPDAGVRFYVVRERELGQKSVPPLENLIVGGSFSFNLKPKARIGAKQRVVMSDPGAYLLRVESLHTQRDHEHFAAIDLEVR
jgi:hypothetical protein